jgi:hypothetical protein
MANLTFALVESGFSKSLKIGMEIIAVEGQPSDKMRTLNRKLRIIKEQRTIVHKTRL